MKKGFVDALMRIRKSYHKSMEKVCGTYDLTMNELSILVFLANNPEYDRATDFVEHRGMSKSHVSLSVGSLEQRGLLERHYHPGDRKSAHLSMTPAAVEMATAGQNAQQEFVHKLFSGLSEEEMKLLGNAMDRVLNNLEH